MLILLPEEDILKALILVPSEEGSLSLSSEGDEE